eukprot:Nitzschia sp. Nitz4//scaffold190_size42200//30078//33516//NITZ4_007394-RA/size42200-processed-gene-0.52-mRNA-1//-1//CDS//3329540150//585//frame0
MVDRKTFEFGAADLATEACFLSLFDHPNIVKLHGVTAGTMESNVSSGKDAGFFLVVDRLVETLEDRIERWKHQSEELSHRSLFYRLSKEYKEKQNNLLVERIETALKVAVVIEYLHDQNILFRDLKPDNIGFDAKGMLKLFDFGLAREAKECDALENGTYKMSGHTGSRRYMAPEVARGKAYNKSVDVYSFGILLWEMCSLEKPYMGYSSKRHMKDVVLGGERPKMDGAKCAIQDILAVNPEFQVAGTGGREALVVLADSVARALAASSAQPHVMGNESVLRLETLDQATTTNRRRKKATVLNFLPYVLERSDVWCSQVDLHVSARLIGCGVKPSDESTLSAVQSMLEKITSSVVATDKMLEIIACVCLQERIRVTLREKKAVAFVSDGSILPRKSGTSDLPMASPPALPFKAPPNSPMEQTISVEMGVLAKYLPSKYCQSSSTTATLSGLLVLEGITLICGGGYHGKSTLLQTIAMGIYNKIPGDGREYCVTVPEAVTVRAEDGRYVNQCNISAFISNLPTPPGVSKAVDTTHFCTKDSSGSTSQAANVSEAVEMGATAMLVDEDVSAANFMARDGRMRSLVMDESITPLLYRVNGLFQSKGISSIVVVGGVGDWLDVPHNVLLLDKYVASDATKKAQSISHQFSHGHVQYAGRGVVHRLEWPKSGTPIPRRPVDSFSTRYSKNMLVALMDGGQALSIHPDNPEDFSHDPSLHVDDEEGIIEASRLEQLVDKKQLFGCGICVLWILQTAPKMPNLGLPHLLEEVDKVMDQSGLQGVIEQLCGSVSNHLINCMIEEVGTAYRPRKFEIGQAFTRMYGIQLEELPVEEDQEELQAKLEAERKKQELLKIWANRRTSSK